MSDAPSQLLRQAYNRARFEPGQTTGHYESWFVRGNHPTRPLAFWIRYTVFAPKGPSEGGRGELWAVAFDGETGRHTVRFCDFPLDRCRFSPRALDVDIAGARLREGSLVGRLGRPSAAIDWDLRYDGDDPPLPLLPPAWYGRPLPKAKQVAPHPRVRLFGSLNVEGTHWAIDGWPGSQNHNWGARHTDRYAWGQVVGFRQAPNTVLECATVRLRLGPIWTPWLTVLVLQHEGRRYAINGPGRAVLARAHYHGHTTREQSLWWSFETGDRHLRARGRFEAQPDAFVGLPYRNPPGGTKVCLNTKLARCRLIIEPRGRPPQMLSTEHGAAFEIIDDMAPSTIAMRTPMG